MRKVEFIAAQAVRQITALRSEFETEVGHLAERATCSNLRLPVVHGSASVQAERPLTIAFVGQYNAGKSTLVKVLTGRDDIQIDSDICTNEARAFDWNGIQLIDTPGILAGRTDHDAITGEVLESSDLLIFVVSNELFDNYIGEYFRTLAFHRHKAQEMMLVVNKMSQDSGSPAVKRAQLEKVTHPLKLEQLYTVFTDAESYLEAQTEPDPADRDAFIEFSQIEMLIESINRFVADRGLLGQLTTPAFEIRHACRQIADYFSTEFVEEQLVLEILRKREVLLNSQKRLATQFRGALSAASAKATEHGHVLAESLKAGITENEFKALSEETQSKIQNEYKELSDTLEQICETELQHLQSELQVLSSSSLARQLEGRLEALAIDVHQASFEQATFNLDENEKSSGLHNVADHLASLQEISKSLQNLGQFVRNWAAGPRAKSFHRGGRTLRQPVSPA